MWAPVYRYVQMKHFDYDLRVMYQLKEVVCIAMGIHRSKILKILVGSSTSSSNSTYNGFNYRFGISGINNSVFTSNYPEEYVFDGALIEYCM